MKLPEPVSVKCGEWLETCPVQLLYKVPLVQEVISAHRWCKVLHQPLKDKYPSGIPEIMISGVLALDEGMQYAEYERIKKLEAERRSKKSS